MGGAPGLLWGAVGKVWLQAGPEWGQAGDAGASLSHAPRAWCGAAPSGCAGLCRASERAKEWRARAGTGVSGAGAGGQQRAQPSHWDPWGWRPRTELPPGTGPPGPWGKCEPRPLQALPGGRLSAGFSGVTLTYGMPLGGRTSGAWSWPRECGCLKPQLLGTAQSSPGPQGSQSGRGRACPAWGVGGLALSERPPVWDQVGDWP